MIIKGESKIEKNNSGKIFDAEIIEDKSVTNSGSKIKKSLLKTSQKVSDKFKKVLSDKITTMEDIKSSGKSLMLPNNKLGKIVQKTIEIVDNSISYIVKSSSDNRSEVVQYTRSPALFGIWVMIITFGFGGAWSIIAPLDSAAVAQGTVVLEKNKTTIQHFEGGVIDEVLVQDGDIVKEGQIIIRLNKTAALANRDSMQNKVFSYEGDLARLVGLRDGLDNIKFPESILKMAGNIAISQMMQNQEKLFNSTKEKTDGAIQAAQGRIKQHNEVKKAYQAQLEATEKQIKINEDRVGIVEKLIKSGSATQEQLRELVSNLARLQGAKGEYLGQVASADERIGEEKQNIENIKFDFFERTESALRETQERLTDATEELKNREDILDRLEIKSPVSGAVNNLTPLIKGGVIQHNGVIAEIIPQQEKLVIDAQISSMDIDVVRVGQIAHVKLRPFKSRIVPTLDGKVITLSADVVMPTHQMPGQQQMPYYKARIELDAKSLETMKNLKGIDLYPGMPADVFVVIGTRTLMKYLMDPITMTFEKSLREQ